MGGGQRRAPRGGDDAIDADGACVLPGFVDSHAHLVFAGDRTDEFSARMAGERYAAGGIRTTVAATRAATDDELRANVARLTAEMFRQGTTTVEIKSGYGLNVADEVRSLRIASEFTTETTFLGAHVVPAGSDPGEYVQLVTGEMLTACAPYARWADVFCEEGAFDVGAARKVLMAAKHAGLELRVHANQLRPGPGVQLAVELDAASADHCTYLSDDDVDACWRIRARWRLCYPGSSSPRALPFRTAGGCSPRASGSPSPPTATRAPRTPRACRSASLWRSGRWD